MISSRSLLLLLTLACPLSLLAQASDAPELPEGPLLNKAPDFSKWVIAYSYPEDRFKNLPGVTPIAAEQAQVLPREVIVTKTKNIISEKVTTLADVITEKWYSGQRQYVKPPGRNTWYGSDSTDTNDAFYSEPLPRSGFRDLDWVRPDAYVGTIKYKGATVLVFVPGGSQTLPPKELPKQKNPLDTQAKIALIDAETRFPVAVATAGVTQTYTFDTPPTELQTFPADLKAQLKADDEALKKIYQPPGRPY